MMRIYLTAGRRLGFIVILSEAKNLCWRLVIRVEILQSGYALPQNDKFGRVSCDSFVNSSLRSRHDKVAAFLVTRLKRL
ncbi:hypothetical protein [Helicobacter marmotae]|uniref:hypothetical protein n=1 Tax=Helicobacter marmotae TaxID=152490 RepID=UPI0011C02FC8|nr:hypothetical protein [Helicobacter marmotae]